MRFSERLGFKKARDTVQKDGMDDGLRTALWNVVDVGLFRNADFGDVDESIRQSTYATFFTRLYHSFLHAPLDTLPYSFRNGVQTVRELFFRAEWHWVYDFIEFAVEAAPKAEAVEFEKLCNRVLEDHLSAYRFVDKRLVPITNEQELASIDEAITAANDLSAVQSHLRAALTLLADKKSPDYRNSIKEAISAVEALAQALTGDAKATLGQALKVFEKKAVIHPALKSSLSSLYGWTSDAEGIRHAMLDESKLTYTDAKFMLVACTSFINFLMGKAAEQGVKLKPPK